MKMKKFRVQATPKGGTCSQVVEARDEMEAVAIARSKANNNNWTTAAPRTTDDWNFHAKEVK